MIEFNAEQEDVVRVPLSLKFVANDMYDNLIVPARNARMLTKLIQDLLQLYYENEYVRDLIERPEEVETGFTSDYDAIMQQINDLLATQKEAADKTLILETQVGGMNAYLEQQQEILSAGLDGGFDGGFDFDTGADVRDTTVLAITDTKMTSSRVTEPMSDSISVDLSDEIEDITTDEDDLDDDWDDTEDEPVAENGNTDVVTTPVNADTVKHTAKMHSAVKKPTGVQISANLQKFMSNMEKT